MMPFNASAENSTQTYGEIYEDNPENDQSTNSSGQTYYYYYFNWESFFSQFRFQLDIFLWNYISFVITFISVFGNLTIVFVLLQKRSRRFSTSIFITSLAVADFLVCFSPLEGWLTLHRFIKPTYSDLDCKLRMFLPKAAQYASVWMLAIISIERAVSVKVPLKVKTIFTVKFARCFVVIVWALAFAKAALGASIVSLISELTGNECYVSLSKYHNLYYADLVLYTVLVAMIPYPIILVCSILTISVLLQNALRKSKSKKTQVKSITITLLLVNLMYLFSVTPAVVHEIYTLLWLRFNKYLRWTFEDYYNHVNLTNLFTFAEFFHHALNFFIYFLSGSRFRKETKDLLLSCCSKKTTMN